MSSSSDTLLASSLLKRMSWVIGSGLFLFLGTLAVHHYQTVHAPHLRLDARTSAIFQNASRVEVYRLADFNESRYFTAAEIDAIRKLHKQLGDYTVVQIGKNQNRDFAVALAQAFASADDPKKSSEPSCFDPGLAFRIHGGTEYVDVFICFYCSGVDIVTRNAQNQFVSEEFASLGEARAPLLLLYRNAFPDDARLQALR